MIKPIVCPECIKLLEKEESPKEGEEDIELEKNTTVKIFTDWKNYAYHILKEHPESNRAVWVISSVNVEIEKYKKLNQPQPQSITKLEELITNGKVKIPAKASEENIIEDDNTWQEQLAALHQKADKKKKFRKKKKKLSIPLKKAKKPSNKRIIFMSVVIAVVLIGMIVIMVIKR